MNHRIVSVSVLLIIGMFAVAAFVFAGTIDIRLPFTASGPQVAPIPHPRAALDSDCSECHRIDEGTLPVTHRNYSQQTCRSCHRLSPPVLIPHSVELGETGCPLCHADPNRNLGMPRSHLTYPERQCMFCHSVEERRAGVEPRRANVWRSPAPDITHETTGIFSDCISCHDVDGTPPMPPNHERFEAETCVWCHEQAEGAAGTQGAAEPGTDDGAEQEGD